MDNPFRYLYFKHLASPNVLPVSPPADMMLRLACPLLLITQLMMEWLEPEVLNTQIGSAPNSICLPCTYADWLPAFTLGRWMRGSQSSAWSCFLPPWPKTRRSKTISTNPSAMNSPAGVSTHWLQGGFRFGMKSNYYRGAV